jgi:putative FmdB family regulatory protein
VPIYTYTCVDCNDVIEKRQSFSDAPLTTCEQCGGGLRKVLHPVGIVFKGSGWYITDSRSTSSNGASGKRKASSTTSDSSTSPSGSTSKENASPAPAATKD